MRFDIVSFTSFSSLVGRGSASNLNNRTPPDCSPERGEDLQSIPTAASAVTGRGRNEHSSHYLVAGSTHTAAIVEDPLTHRRRREILIFAFPPPYLHPALRLHPSSIVVLCLQQRRQSLTSRVPAASANPTISAYRPRNLPCRILPAAERQS